ncbi:hypothetical protein G9X66_35705 [Rhizobium indigoferae]|nr:hypothetical protein [Rhizobium indigoferae]
MAAIHAEDRNSTYRSGRYGDWLKIKCIQSDSFAIVGYQRSSSAFRNIRALLLAARREGQLVYVGSVGTGFKANQALELRGRWTRLRCRRLQ